MDQARVAQAVVKLQMLIRTIVGADVKNSEGWHDLRKSEGFEGMMSEGFGYEREAGMPSITTLVKPFFHPTKALVGLNYTPVAHNTLHRFPKGWTDALRLCRGIVFDRQANLVAFPFPKFFNYGEHEETKGTLPEGPFEAMDKADGHLAIIFSYRGKVMATTRGSFVSPTAQVANKMLATKNRSHWQKVIGRQQTVLAEIIHPRTKVIVDYGRRRGFILLGCYDLNTYADLDHAQLSILAQKLKTPVAELVPFASIAELKAKVAEKDYKNREGFVVRFVQPDGSVLRVKFKYAGYLGIMLEEKLTYGYVMNRLLDGSLERTLAGKPHEVEQEVRGMVTKLMAVNEIPDDSRGKARRAYLRELVDEASRTTSYCTQCGKFSRWALAQQSSS
ncbi:MAG: T4 RnlA family RNA ligase [Candidatus Obscuribacterales bacterium]|nr:T4 RnlA family RNA ligase [Candidatus Obscuribacterales bacterium]